MYLRNKGKKKKRNIKKRNVCSLHDWNGCSDSNTPLKHMEQFIIWSFSPPAFRIEHLFSAKMEKDWTGTYAHILGILYWVGSSSTSTKPQVWGLRPGFPHPLLCGLQAEPAVPLQCFLPLREHSYEQNIPGTAVSVQLQWYNCSSGDRTLNRNP